MAQLEGTRLALVTGSTSGIGLGIAQELAKKGHDVVLHGFGTPEVIQSVVQRCRGALPAGVDKEFHHHGADLCDPTQISDMFQFIHAKYGRGPDILINNAGIQYVEKVESMPVEKWDQVIAVNLSAPFHTIRHALPGMRERGWGRVVNISSVHGLVGSPLKAPYVASKHGLLGLTKVGAMVVYLCSDEARQVTGSTLTIDGGWTIK